MTAAASNRPRPAPTLFHVSVFLLIALFGAPAPCPSAHAASFTFCTPNLEGQRIFHVSSQLLTTAFERMGHDFELVTYPAKRCPVEVSNGRVDGDAHRVYTFNDDRRYPNLVRVEESIQPVDQSVFSKIPNLRMGGWKDLLPYTVIYLPGIKVIERGLDGAGIPVENRIPVLDHEDGFRRLARDRGDLLITSSHTGRQFIKKMNLSKSGIRLLRPPLARFELHPYMNGKHVETARKLSEILNKMKKDGTWLKIVQGD